MVDVEYRPVQKIVVHEIIKYDLREFTQIKAIPNNHVRWIDGIIFSPAAFPLTPQLIDEQVKGIVHWGLFEFAEMDEYMHLLTNPSTGVSVPVLNNSNNTAVSDFIRWLKKQPQRSPKLA